MEKLDLCIKYILQCRTYRRCLKNVMKGNNNKEDVGKLGVEDDFNSLLNM